ncbi:unnamed protein product [Penicillium glandicola]
MTEQTGRTAEPDEWPATMSLLAADLELLTPHETARSEPQPVTATASDSREHSPAQIPHGCSPLKKSSSGSALGSQAFTQPSVLPSHLPLSSPQSSLVSSPQSSFVSSHHQSSSSTSTIRPAKPVPAKPLPANTLSSNTLPTYPLNFTPGFYPGPFNFVPQVYSPLFQSQFYQRPPGFGPQVYHNPVDFAPQSYPTNVFEPAIFPSNTTNMGWPFSMDEVPNYGDFERFENSSIEELLQRTSIPFGTITEMNTPSCSGVVMISNLPYTVTRQEVASFLGRSANLLPSSQGCPIHIIMERSTGKTMDCYVEFATPMDAQDTVERINRGYDAGSTPRIGSRHVDIELSTPAKLLKATFPRAKCISWEGGKPTQLVNKDSWSTGFDGFLTDEELFCLTRHAEQPHRSAFASKVPQRCYESFISTIWKFPWHATHLYTVHHRNALFKTLGTLIRTLVERMQKTNTVGLDIRLLNELVNAGLCCPGFNPRMKYCFAWWSNDKRGIETLDHDWCLYFPFDTMTYLPGHGSAAIQFYAYIMSNGSVLRTENEGLPNKHTHPEIERIFGRFWFEWEDDVARNTVFKDAAIYEASVLRKFIITGYQHLHKRKSSISTIGTAPGSSPTHSLTSLDSERTISASHGDSVNPGRTSQEALTTPAARDMTRRLNELGLNLNAIGNPRDISQRLEADQYLPDTPTRQAPSSVRPYIPPHHRDAHIPRNQSVSWRMPQPQEAHVGGSTQSQAQIRPVYRAPHPTAQNVRSSSDPFNPVPSAAPTSHRSRSDATRLSNIDRQVFHEFRPAGRGKPPAKK